jgi:[methyl-Co(III) methanol-specific corrinoid protein]:coenzyme M methyltransferase
MEVTISPKERLSRVFARLPVERPPVICPGGMMNSAVVDVMTATGHVLPDAHNDTQLMIALAEDIANHTGFENIGVPFCMTVEAQALGSDVDFGTLECEPKIKAEKFPDAESVAYLPKGAIAQSARGRTVIETIGELSKRNPDVPVIGSITGPVSTAASIIDPMTFLKQLRKNKDAAHKVMDYVTNQIIEYALLCADNGASVISIADPTATGEILGPKFFDEYAVPYLNKLAQAIKSTGKPVIIHICGDVGMVKPGLAKLNGNALSVDSVVNLKKIKDELGGMAVMGNVSTYLLQFGKENKIAETSARLIEQGIDIIAPACGLSTSTPVANIKALTNTVISGG